FRAYRHGSYGARHPRETTACQPPSAIGSDDVGAYGSDGGRAGEDAALEVQVAAGVEASDVDAAHSEQRAFGHLRRSRLLDLQEAALDLQDRACDHRIAVHGPDHGARREHIASIEVGVDAR